MGGTLGIIAEYDPFHRGHLYHLREAKRITDAEFVICVMSGGFTQRGELSYFDKYLRAEAAVRNGADLVIELPFVYACNNAEYFAKGAVDILSGLGCVDFISFGSESGDIAALTEVARVLAKDEPELNAIVREGMQKGWPYPKARAYAVSSVIGAGARRILVAPNDILATEYLRRLITIGSAIKPVAVKRFACAEDESNAEAKVAGGTALRAMLSAGEDVSDYLTEETRDVIAEYDGRGILSVKQEALLPLLLYRIEVSESTELAQIFSATEGLENRLARAARRAASLAEVIRFTKTRRYTETRIKRLMAHTAVGLTKADMAEAEDADIYARVLAFSEGGARLMRRIRKSARIPIITNPNKQLDADNAIARFDRRAAALYRILQTGSISGYDDTKIFPKI